MCFEYTNEVHHCIHHLSQTGSMAFIFGNKVVSVSTATSIDKEFTFSSLLVVEVSSESCPARSDHLLLGAQNVLRSSQSSTLVVALVPRFEIVPVSTASSVDEDQAHALHLVVVPAGVAGLAQAGLGCLVAVGAVQGVLGGFTLFRQDTSPIRGLNVSLLAATSNNALKSAELGWVLVVVAGQGAGGAAFLEFLVLSAHGIG